MTRFVALALALLVLGSGTRPAPPTCEPIEGLAPLLAPGRILLLGELHGTRQSPAFVLDAACQAARSGLSVVVGLELRAALQPDVDAFLRSQGSEQDRRSLLEKGQWRWSYQDGRASRAMLELLDGLRALRAAGRKVRVVLFDESGADGPQSRERAMAAHLAAAAAQAEAAVTIVLTGNRHSRTTPGSSRSASHEPMGYLLGRATSFERIVALDVAHGGGSAWICSPDCGVTPLGGRHGERRWAVEVDQASRPAGHHGRYHVGMLEASPPARFRAEQAAGVAAAVERAREAARARRAEPGQAAPSPAPPDDAPLTEAETRIQGAWQAYDHGSRHRTWRIRFDGRRFRAEGGPDDWYEGRIALRPDAQPAWLDFAIEDCRCSYVDETSRAIYRWEGDALIVSAPQPGAPRPEKFVENSGSMMRLVRPAE